MFFTNYEFLFLFLPVVWLGFAGLLATRRTSAAAWWLLGASLVFYASLDSRHVPHLAFSVVVNFLLALGIARMRSARPVLAFRLMCGGVVFNVAFLAGLKYADLLWSDAAAAAIPLGISFYTIQQIAFLVGLHGDPSASAQPLRRYGLFVVFFPYVIAGPVVLRQEVFESFGSASVARMKSLFLPALTLFSIGLFKKIMFADNLGLHVDPVFTAAERGTALSALDAWGAAALYTLQIYFDFSGYSDMACGLAGMFGIRLPRNFHSPLKARSIMEFWRRWHMSATRFFTNHVYLPIVLKLMRRAVRWQLGGVSRYLLTVLLPMLLTFVLIGLWHGAGTTAMVFGLLMGVAISVNHLWIKLDMPALPGWLGAPLTLLVVMGGMVFSRADNMQVAATLFTAMLGLGSSPANGVNLLDLPRAAAWLFGLGAVALLAPNSNEIMAASPVVLPEAFDNAPAERAPARWRRQWVWQKLSRWQWRADPGGAVFVAAVFCASAVLIPTAGQFIYYRF